MKRSIQNLRKRKHNKGYTLVELVVVIAIMMILAGGAAFGIMKWIEWTQFKQQNEYARTLFSAAQNQLSEYASSGQLSELQTNVEKAKTINDYITSLKNSDGEAYNLNAVFPQSADKTESGRYQEEIYSITGTANDYKNYLNGTASAELTAMYDMFQQYLYDTSILSATICVEFTADDGQVFAVLYSNKDTGFEYNSGNSNRRGTVDITNRQTSYRKARMTGYYGVDELYKATSNKTEKPVLAEVKLNNEDTLNLSFTLSKIKSAAQNMTYEIAVCDKTTKNVQFIITLDGTKIKNEAMQGAVPCDVVRYDYDEAGTKTGTTKMGEYDIFAYIDATGTIRVILDAADLAATSGVYYDAYAELMQAGSLTLANSALPNVTALKEAYSFRRFGVDVEDIYCTIQGSGKDYKTTAKRQSNSENAYMGSVQSGTSEDGTTTTAIYTVKNARHLYNMRYLEDYTEAERTATGYAGLKTADQITYQVTEDIDWSKFTGTALFNGGVPIKEDENPAFPSILQLRQGMTIESGSNKLHTITGLKLSETENAAATLYGLDANDNNKKIEKGPVGLFLENAGTIQSLVLDKVSVTGTQYVGTFCGENAGTLSKLEVKNSDDASSVVGTYAVGGITGAQSGDATKVRYTELTNRAAVTGSQSVGGIIGTASSDKVEENIIIYNCNNYGRINVTDTAAAADKNVSYFGGIAGYLESKGSYSLSVQNCKSSPQYTDDELNSILSDVVPQGATESPIEAKLKGTYVGGIVGYVDGVTVANCNTKRENTTTNGYVFGYQYVGGIIGGSSEATLTIQGNNTNNINEAYVLADSYAGGIIGDSNSTTNVESWTNRAVVAVRTAYAGGIVGSNTGTLHNCSSDVDNTKQAKAIRNSNLFQGNYVGGIAGYNSGKMTNTDKTSIVPYVVGKDFVGGVVGYNDVGYNNGELLVESEVTNYEVAGGYVIGSGTYVGGYAGCNRSIQLLEKHSLVSNPNEVNGKYCVGGVIGGNIIAPLENVTTYFAANNFLGQLNAEAFAGGFIGYNQLITSTNLAAIKTQLKDNAKSLDELNGESVLKDAMDEVTVSGLGNNSKELKITGLETEPSQSRLEDITGKIYVAGVLGYNHENTTLYIKDVVNKTPVTATSSIENSGEQGATRKDYNKNTFTYSYVGGIIGKVTSKTTLDNCANQGKGDVTTVGTYLGSLCEINEGTIKKCSVSSIGTKAQDYVGGIAGLNKSGATIESTTFANKTITGRNYVGGIAAENFGIIQATDMNSNAVVNGASQVGGIAGYNGTSGSVALYGTNAIRISATGNDIGGVIGMNQGTLSYTGTNKAGMSGYITGDQNVGGFIGLNKAGNVSRLQNEAAVTSANGAAGGIIGADESPQSANISSCDNYGIITATKSGNAGGIIGENKGTINQCKDYAQVSAPNGVLGGITGVNTGTIQESEVVPELALTFTGKNDVGGISGTNSGNISDCSVQNLVLTNLSSSKGSAMGGITGTNSGWITACNVGTSDADIEIKSLATNVSLGGVTGTNTGTIKGTNQTTYGKVYAKLRFTQTDMAYYGFIGGIAGTNNSGTIQYYEFNGQVVGTANNPQNAPEYNPNSNFETNGSTIYGYGGIVGVNGNSGAKSTGTVSSCKVDEASITGLGDANNIANIGGVAGVNGLGATISNVTFGTEDKYAPLSAGSITNTDVKNVMKDAKASVYVGTGTSTSAYGHTGGVAGLNCGTIASIGTKETEATEDTESIITYSDTIDDTSVIVENYRGHVGGITGYNRPTGNITKVATGNKWIVYAVNSAQDNGCGGMIGYQASENGASYCYNRAAVVKIASNSNAVGGLIGRMEVAGDGNWQISHCENYGNIYANKRAGGIIGVWKYYGGTVSYCKNYAAITESGGEGAGGIVAMLYGVYTTPAKVVNSENHGTVKCSVAGGIIGTDQNSAGKTYVVIQKCVNTGLIQSGSKSAGILGQITATLVSGSKVEACNNYGYGINSNSFYGIVSPSTKNISVSKSFGLASISYPIASSDIGLGTNYFLTNSQPGEAVTRKDDADKDTTEVPSSFYVRQMSMSGKSVANGTNLYYTLRATNPSGETGNAYCNSQSQPGTYIYNYVFNRQIDLSYIYIMWAWGTANGRVMDYTIEASDYTDPTNSNANWRTIATQKDKYADTQDMNGMKVIDVNVAGTSAHMIRIVVTSVTGTSNNNLALQRMWVNGNVTIGNATTGTKTYSYDGRQGAGAIFADGSTTYTPYEGGGKLTKSNITNGNAYKGLAYEEIVYTSASGQGNVGKGTGANVNDYTVAAGTYMLNQGTIENPIIVGLPGFTINPWTYMGTSVTTAKSDTSLLKMGNGTDNVRYLTFLADNPYFTTDAKIDVTSLAKPVVKEPEDIGSATYSFSWGTIEGATCYDYEAEYLDANGNEITTRKDTIYNTSVSLSVTSVNGVDVAEVRFKVRAGADTTSSSDGKLHKIWSEYSDVKILDLATKPILPTPQYHLELIEDGNTFKYQAILDNKKTYQDFINENHLNISLSDITITVEVGSTKLTFNAEKGVSTSYYNGNGNTGAMFFVQATDNTNTCTSSSKPVRESQAPSSSNYKTTDNMATIGMKPDNSAVGFQGTTADTLSYNLTAAYTRFITYMRSEFVATDKELGVPVAVSTSQIRISDTTSGAIPTLLSSLPANIFSDAYSDLMLRSYPVMMSNNVVYTGHTVDVSDYKADGASGLTKEQLKNLYVTSDGKHQITDTGTDKLIQTDSNGKTKLADGYVLELATDGTYTIYYNALLNSNKNYDYDVQDSRGMNNQVFYFWLTNTYIPSTQVTPVIHYNDTGLTGEDGDPNQDTLTITWDQDNSDYIADSQTTNNYKVGAIYDYVVTGKTTDGTAVQLDAGTYTTATDAQNILTYDTSEWNYIEIDVAITRRGTANAKGFTTLLPAGDIKVIDMKLRFSQITKPDVILHKEEGVVQKNTLVYDATWDNIPAGERVTGTDTILGGKQLKNYEVSVTRSDTDTAASQTYDNKDTFDAAKTKAEELYSSKDGVNTSPGTNQTTYTWVESGTKYQVTKKMVLSWTEDTVNNQYTLDKKLTETWVFEATSDDIAADSVTKILDLNDYERGEVIDIAVKAIAMTEKDLEEGKEYPITYRDGAAGVISEMTLPSRLDVPDVSDVTSEPTYGEKKSVTTTEFAKGLDLSLTPKDESGVLQGKYEIAAAIYNKKDEDTVAKVANSGDATDESGQSGYWNSGAIETLLTKASETAMDGNLVSATYNLAMTNPEYAGKWVKIALRSISESNVSSMWSDEDDKTEKTVDYQWIQIPRVQVDMPQIATTHKTLYYKDSSWRGNPNQTSEETVNDLPVIQTELTFDEIANADQYQMQLIRGTKADAEIDADKNYVIQYTDWVYAEKKKDGSYNIFYTSSDPAFDPTPYWEEKAKDDTIPDCAQNENAVYLGKVEKDGDFRQLPYTEVARENVLDTSAPVNVVSYIQRSASGFNLVLPDAESVGDYVDSSFLFTSQVAVGAEITDANTARYADSEINDWYRKNDGTSSMLTLEKYEKIDGLDTKTFAITTSSRTDTAYEINTSSSYRLLYDIQVLNGSGNVVSERYMSSYCNGDTKIDNVTLLPDDIYAQYQGKTVKLRVATIIKIATDSDGTTHGALSQWSDWKDLDPLPALTIDAPTVESKDTTLEGSVSDNTTKDVDANAFTWSEQTKAKSYQIKIGDQTYDTADYSEGSQDLNSITSEITTDENGQPLTTSLQMTVTPTLEITFDGEKYIYTLTVPKDVTGLSIQAVPVNDNYSVTPWTK